MRSIAPLSRAIGEQSCSLGRQSWAFAELSPKPAELSRPPAPQVRATSELPTSPAPLLRDTPELACVVAPLFPATPELTCLPAPHPWAIAELGCVTRLLATTPAALSWKAAAVSGGLTGLSAGRGSPNASLCGRFHSPCYGFPSADGKGRFSIRVPSFPGFKVNFSTASPRRTSSGMVSPFSSLVSLISWSAEVIACPW